ncbi:hypothetical protein D3C84_428670 [compost metagenome]
MDSDVERLLWIKARQIYGDSLSTILSEALLVYKRAVGFDHLTRLYSSTAGSETLLILRQALIRRWPSGHFGHPDSCVEMRSRLRSYLTQFLLRRLVSEHPDSSVLRDAMFGLDLGV